MGKIKVVRVGDTWVLVLSSDVVGMVDTLLNFHLDDEDDCPYDGGLRDQLLESISRCGNSPD